MKRDELTRRDFLRLAAAGAAVVTVPSFLAGCAKKGAAGALTRPEPLGPAASAFAEFGVDEAVARKLIGLALSKGGEFCDLYFQRAVRHSVSLEDNEVTRARTTVDLGLGVRVLKGDSTGYAYTEELTPESMTKAAAAAAVIASAGRGPAAPPRFALRSHPVYYSAGTAWQDVGIERKIPLLQTLNDRTFAADKRILKVNVGYRDEESHILIANSEGELVADDQPMTVIYLDCVAEDKGRRESNFYGLAGRAGIELWDEAHLGRMVDRTVKRTLILFEAVEAPPGEMPVVLAAGSSGILLHEAIGHGMEADFNRKKISTFSDRMGKRVAEPFVSIVDDATCPGARGAINVDDEGSPTERTKLVDRGVLASYLHDRLSAKHYKTRSTGNGRRESFRHMPIPRMRCTYMEPGPHRKEEIIGSVKRGLYAETFTNGQVMIGAGDFSFFVKNGYLIEEGKITAPVKDVNIIGNGPEVLGRITMVADDLILDEGGWTCGKDGQHVPVSQGLPTVLVSAITVGGRSAKPKAEAAPPAPGKGKPPKGKAKGKGKAKAGAGPKPAAGGK